MISLQQLSNKVVVIVGATASGKSQYAMGIAQQLNGVIINADSMQVYRNIPILTAQPSVQDTQLVSHMLYGIKQCDEYFSVGMWLELVKSSIIKVQASGKVPIIVGGSGLYIKALVYGFVYTPVISAGTKAYLSSVCAGLSLDCDRAAYNKSLHELLKDCDEESYQKLKVNDEQRILRALAVYHETGIPLSKWHTMNEKWLNRDQFYVVLIQKDRDELYRRCDARFVEMLNIGALEEAQYVLASFEKYPKVLGLFELMEYVSGKMSLADSTSQAQQKIRNYAKRQLTWFRHQIDYDEVIR
ncbi:tRNA (adenosine(37)-N6)-dimethylallyltransferase MiaA [Rickettsiales endosymbiont of Peranema trichophorum]|uniref:tRNA (adenosine(37)-N6)-dimethylallyltransferase MiaA n=1 Tax=Rickettsiales endosymbiont of Peranema trichophorum TaxID=2486577 RepID=UPI001022F318|nr:tRNA (adenosine(37)-N6)-dimethylallyltransferase MiaA [Rickettsiales endosymbiont of Peranema trichophorum]RZI46007.1 tRNA (adenosine(37)-N6)-dimethylallyltransferase MiaA [Rickettsiales endosymbiont of Peranema trichophorum]